MKKQYPLGSSLDLSNLSELREFHRRLSEANEPEIEEIERQVRESLAQAHTIVIHN